MKLKYKIITTISYILYVFLIALLIYEALSDGMKSSKSSNNVSNSIAGAINGISGDKSNFIEPTSIKIKSDKDIYYVGEETKLNIIPTPNNSTYNTYKYELSNEDIAKIDNDIIEFLNPGIITIKAINNYNNISDEITFEILPINATAIKSSIDAEMEDGIYKIKLGNKYYINNDFNPINTTNKSITYEILNNDNYINIENNVINPIRYSDDEIIIIKIKNIDIYDEIKLKVEYNDKMVVNLKSFEVEDMNIYVGDIISPNIIFNPTNVTFKDYILESNNDIIEIKNNKIVAKGIGSVDVYITTSGIKKSFKINILNKEYDMFIPNIIINHDVPIIINDSYDKYIDIKYEYDNEYLEINDNVITPKKVGITTIKYNIFGNIKEKEIEIHEDIHINNIYDIKNNNVYLINQLYELNQLFNDSNMINISDFSFYSNSSNIVFIDNKFKILNSGAYKIYILDKISNKYIDANVYAYDEVLNYDVNLNRYQNENIVLNPANEYQIIKSNTFYTSINNNILDIYANDIDDNYYNILIKFDDGFIYDTNSKIHININDVYTSKIDVSNIKDIYVSDEIKLDIKLDEDTTNSDISYEYSDNLYFVSDKIIKAKNIGNAYIKIIDNLSNINVIKEFNISNKIIIDENKPYIFSGIYRYEDYNNTLIMSNSDTISINYNFNNDSTYKKVKFDTADPSIINISEDGKIIALKEGKTTITLSINDGIYDRTDTIDLCVEMKGIVFNDDHFSFLIRKLIGHFLAFLALGLFASIALYFTFNKKYMYFAIAFNLLSGFTFAAFTEFLQTKVNKRTGIINDVFLDYGGYISSAFVISIIFIIIIVKRKKKKI